MFQACTRHVIVGLSLAAMLCITTPASAAPAKTTKAASAAKTGGVSVGTHTPPRTELGRGTGGKRTGGRR
ncbi:hypothetical protein LRS13_01950 [Svornostia abyssi]|uniref:Uncharacterized protein n=1 Tax=Svornostia abyssi TaxID=2898438 RepID=A0ABY5PI06_9ACTN|nr:hypothetical protein LRS13_01950 [Parviterribacteraceae bacterium J379]